MPHVSLNIRGNSCYLGKQDEIFNLNLKERRPLHISLCSPCGLISIHPSQAAFPTRLSLLALVLSLSVEGSVISWCLLSPSWDEGN